MIAQAGVLMRLEQADQWRAYIRAPCIAMQAIGREKPVLHTATDFQSTAASMGMCSGGELAVQGWYAISIRGESNA